MFSVFVYNDIMRKEIQDTLKLTPSNEQFAVVRGKMFLIFRLPIFFNENDISKNRCCRNVLGSILTFENKHREVVLNALDAYHGCSLSRLSINDLAINHPHDLMYRSTITAYPITFDNIQRIEYSYYQREEGKRCTIYMGNTTNAMVLKLVQGRKDDKISDGVYKKGFVDLLKRKGYL